MVLGGYIDLLLYTVVLNPEGIIRAQKLCVSRVIGASVHETCQ